MLAETGIEKILFSFYRQEILNLLSKGRTRKQILFTVDSYLNDGSISAAKFLVEMLKRNYTPDEELINQIESKIKNHINNSERKN